MRKRIFHTSLNLLIEPASYQRLKRAAMSKKTSMAQLIRDGINLRLDQIDKDNNAVMTEQKQDEPNLEELEIELIL
jgi:hypothetical protein